MGLTIDQLNNPIPAEWADYVTQSPVSLETIPDQLYSTQTYVSATSLQLTFFNAVAANQSLSNMTQPGMLPNPQSFLIQAIRMFFRATVETTSQSGTGTTQTGHFNDVVQLVNTGRLVLTIGQKTYGPWRLWTLPGASGPAGALAAAGATAANLVTDYAQVVGPIWGMFPNLMIAPLQNFQVDIFWPAALTLTGNLDIECLFDGQRARAVQ